MTDSPLHLVNPPRDDMTPLTAAAAAALAADTQRLLDLHHLGNRRVTLDGVTYVPWAAVEECMPIPSPTSTPARSRLARHHL